MKHYMKLHNEPFIYIKSGLKTIELRLCDEKRMAICVGDEIEFSNTSDTNRTLLCRVIALHKFPSFEELYNTLPLLKCGYTTDDIATATPDDMNQYYPKEAQQKYGVLGIEIKLI